jgi:amino acid transporter
MWFRLFNQDGELSWKNLCGVCDGSYAFGEPTLTRLGALILILSALASPSINSVIASAVGELSKPKRDPKTGGEAPLLISGFPKDDSHGTGGGFFIFLVSATFFLLRVFIAFNIDAKPCCD